MKVLYDYQIFSRQNFGGVSRYFTQIMNNLPLEIQYEIGVKYSDNEYLNNQMGPDLERYYDPFIKFLPNYQFKGKRRLYNFVKRTNKWKYEIDFTLFNKQRSIELLKKQDFDVFHPTYYDDYFLEFIGKKPFVLTIHDMIHELFPEIIFEPKLLNEKAKIEKKYSHIIAVSNNTKNDIIDILKIAPEKISVVYHANSLIKNGVIDIEIPDKYILYVGERHFYKNFLFFSSALETILMNDQELFILCAGNPFNDSEIQFLDRLNIRDRFITIKASDQILATLYKKALAFVYPSYYEGFGIPILEAFYMKCPVLLNDSSCFKEIAGDAALYFNSKCTKSIVVTANKILTDSNLRESLKIKGSKRVSEFSWKESALKTSIIYKSCYDSK